ncbi:hypothetical protein C8R46DRAFT_369650 [Mycena filopes]|nr:hypothetical protein C8R46DRAFT_369650 [Mycena filopes]
MIHPLSPSLSLMLPWILANIPLAASAPFHNVTISVPDTTITHGDRTLCTPMPIQDILSFFLANYIAHAVTVKSYPGESRRATLQSFLAALVMPASGLVRGLDAIARHAIFTKGKLDRAAQAGALCMVVRNKDWRPQRTDGAPVIRDIKIVRRSFFDVRVNSAEMAQSLMRRMRPIDRTQREAQLRNRRVTPVTLTSVQQGFNRLLFAYARTVKPWIDAAEASIQTPHSPPIVEKVLDGRERNALSTGPAVSLTAYIPSWINPGIQPAACYIGNRSVQGANKLPPGYSFAFVPRDAKVESFISTEEPVLSSSYNIPKAAIGVLQIVYASFSLYHSRDIQIAEYGFTAFGLTVLPYLLMTLVNLLGNFLTPDYGTLHLVESEVLLEAKRRTDGAFHGMVGKLLSLAEGTEPPNSTTDTGSFEFQEASDGNPSATQLILDDRPAKAIPASQQPASTTDIELTDLPSPTSVEGSTSSHNTRVGVKVSILDVATPLTRETSCVYVKIPGCGRYTRRYMPSEESKERPDLHAVALFVAVAVLITLFGYLSNWFSRGASTRAQQVWIGLWLAFGFVFGCALVVFRPAMSPSSEGGVENGVNSEESKGLWLIVGYSVPFIGGFVVVGRMLREYGNCVSF